MITKRYRIADRIIEVTSFYEGVHRLCTAYTCDGEPDFSVTVTQEDIDHEYAMEDRCAASAGRPVNPYTVQYQDIVAVCRLIGEKMTEYDTVLFHGSAVAVDGETYLFTAVSGTGKSTHTRLWRELLGDRAVMVNDDKPLIHITDNGVMAYGTPFNGKHQIGENIAVPLKAICILERSPDNHIERITRDDAYPMLVQQILRPRKPEQMAKTMQLIDLLAAQVQLYRLGCNMDISAAEVAYNAMKG